MTASGSSRSALVVTPKAERYAKQLVSHLGHKLEFRTDGATSTAVIGRGTGQVVVAEDGGALTLIAHGDDVETLDTIDQVLGSHLQRFSQRDELTVVWTGSTDR